MARTQQKKTARKKTASRKQAAPRSSWAQRLSALAAVVLTALIVAAIVGWFVYPPVRETGQWVYARARPLVVPPYDPPDLTRVKKNYQERLAAARQEHEDEMARLQIAVARLRDQLKEIEDDLVRQSDQYAEQELEPLDP